MKTLKYYVSLVLNRINYYAIGAIICTSVGIIIGAILMTTYFGSLDPLRECKDVAKTNMEIWNNNNRLLEAYEATVDLYNNLLVDYNKLLDKDKAQKQSWKDAKAVGWSVRTCEHVDKSRIPESWDIPESWTINECGTVDKR